MDKKKTKTEVGGFALYTDSIPFFFKLSYYFFKQNLECRLAGKDSPGWDDCRMPKALLPLPPSGLLRPFQKALGPCWEGTVDSNDLPEES